jgi:hypothetical protein
MHGPLAIQLLGRERYYIIFIDEFSHYTWIYFIRHKSNIKLIFRTFYYLVETQFSTKNKKLKSDNGDEYVNKEMITILEPKAIMHD